MKTPITSNFRRLLRAFYPFLLAIAAVWAMPRNAQAQLYVAWAQYPSLFGRVSEYDPDSGGVIADGLITDLKNPVGLALSEDGAALFVSNYSGDYVGKFDSRTGDTIKRAFVTIHHPTGIVVDGGQLLIVTETGVRKGAVDVYNADTGENIGLFEMGLETPLAIAADSDTWVSLNIPSQVVDFEGDQQARYVISDVPLANGLAVQSDILYIAYADRVGKFDALTGKAIKRDFITGLGMGAGSLGVAVQDGTNNLFVSYFDLTDFKGKVGKYDAVTGQVIKKDFITGPFVPNAIVIKQPRRR